MVSTYHIINIFIAIGLYAYDPNEESKEAKYAPLVNETVPFYMDKFEKIVEENNGYFVNGKVTTLLIYSTYLFIYLTKN